MSKKDEALKLALDALEAKGDAWIVLERKAKAAIREALAEQPAQQEPVAWRLWDEDPLGGTDHRWAYYDKSDFVDGVDPTKHFKVEPLYTSPPAQRKPLTDEQIEKLREKTFSTGNPYCPVDSKSMRKAARAIEAAHNIKE